MVCLKCILSIQSIIVKNCLEMVCHYRCFFPLSLLLKVRLCLTKEGQDVLKGIPSINKPD